MGQPKFRSLRFRLLLPLLAASLGAALLVATMSAWLGAQWALRNVREQFTGIQRALFESNFPLTAPVLRLLADLTHTQLITLQENGKIAESTLQLNAASTTRLNGRLSQLPERNAVGQGFSLTVGAHTYMAYPVDRARGVLRPDLDRLVLVLFDEQQVRSMRWRAAVLPMVTGLSTILLLGTLSLVLTDRLIGRLKRLQQRVESVANGNFDLDQSDDVQDEVGRLAGAINSMAAQLKGLWQTVHKQQSHKLLHQIAGGMAHQLRNTLTGARMALELHARHRSPYMEEELSVALHEIQRAEDYIRRLLLVGVGQQDRDRPARTLECLQDVQTSLSPISNHHQVEMTWELSDSLGSWWVKDGPALIAAVTNLVLNAMQAGTKVQVLSELVAADQLQVSVIDNGAGVPGEIAEEIFEPFVTSKPEGMGLGLPLVRRAAEHLHGHVEWSRQGDNTAFRLFAKVSKREPIVELPVNHRSQ